jgi:hypothetical protein
MMMRTLTNTLFFGTCFGAFCLALGYQQGNDAKWAVLEAEQAAGKAAYAKGYSKGSSAALVALHLKCIDQTYLEPLALKTMTQVQTQVCDKALTNVVVAYADEVQ